MTQPTRRQTLALAAATVLSPAALAQQAAPFKVGLILPLTGPFTATGRQMEAGARLYLAQHGSTVAGRRIELVVKDDGGVADNTRRVAQELITSEKVDVLAGFGLTPLALSVSQLITQAKVPAVVMTAATSGIVNASPYFVRTSLTLPQSATAMAEWASKNKIKRAVTLVSDYGPGLDAEKYFKNRFLLNGGEVLAELRAPLRAPDFSPFLQRVRDANPEALFVFVPAGQGVAVMKQFAERGLDKVGIKLIGDGSFTDDDILNDMGDVAIGAVTAFNYSAAHESALNKRFVADFIKAHKVRPAFMGVGAYDGMRVIVKALEATKGKGGGDALLEGMKGQTFESPRGMMTIDAQTRDVVQDIYIRRVERRNGELWNIEIDSIKQMKDPGKQG
jgi:branched-chain amino acid transport system substrate-binding protein